MIKIYLLNVEKISDSCFEICKKYFNREFEASKECAKDINRFQKIGKAYLLHSVLGMTEDDIKFTNCGKPISDKAFFNVSHSGKYVALAVGNGEIGVDVQSVEECNIKVKKLFSLDEQNWIGNDKRRLCQLWTIKESLSKAIGCGMNKQIACFDIMHLMQKGSIVYNGTEYFQKSTEIDGYYLTVVTLKKEETVFTKI